MMRFNKDLIIALGLPLCFAALLLFLPVLLRGHYVFTTNREAVVGAIIKSGEKTPETIPARHFSTPIPVKGLYMTSWVAGTPSLRNSLVKLIGETELNTIVIDIKDYSGKIVFPVSDPTLKAYGSEEVRVKDMRQFIAELHSKGVYVIGRVAVFQDAYFVKRRPELAVKNAAGSAVWKDRKGISWIDPGSKEYWDYVVLISKEAYGIGFDEINFDYIRFPSDGDMKNISYPFSSSTPKTTVMKNFFSYLHDQLVSVPGDRVKISADLFGMVTTATDDMGIGQLLEAALPYFDYISPMVYPSHYPPTFIGFKEPEAHPYEVVKYAMDSAVSRRTKLASTTPALAELRPWLQDFGLRQTYTAADVRAQIKATKDAGLDSWLLWSASNKYTRGALENKN